MEFGGAPYLASLRMDQAESWEEFREASNYSNIPGENMIWADREGNIGWQAVGIAPIRRNFSGMVPVPGDGRYEWDGYLPIKAKPNDLNPQRGFMKLPTVTTRRRILNFLMRSVTPGQIRIAGPVAARSWRPAVNLTCRYDRPPA